MNMPASIRRAENRFARVSRWQPSLPAQSTASSKSPTAAACPDCSTPQVKRIACLFTNNTTPTQAGCSFCHIFRVWREAWRTPQISFSPGTVYTGDQWKEFVWSWKTWKICGINVTFSSSDIFFFRTVRLRMVMWNVWHVEAGSKHQPLTVSVCELLC